jgi:hypothetical protein
MKEEKRDSVKRLQAVAVLSAFFLSACGGGSSGSGSTANPAATMSQAQLYYQSFAVAANGGLYDVEGNLQITSASGTASLSPQSSFFTEQITVPASPLLGPQPLTDTVSTAAATLALPTLNPNTRYMVQGAVYTEAFPLQGQVSFSGDNVQNSYYATDGKTVVSTVLGTSYTVVPLTGFMSSSPDELFTSSNVGLITNTINGKQLYNPLAVWQPNSAYIKVVQQISGDTLIVQDCALPDTTGPNLTPCPTTASTLETFFPYASVSDGTTYQLNDGQIVTVAGVRAWVSNNQLAAGVTPQYRVFYQSGGAIYTGVLIKDGTDRQQIPNNGGPAQNFLILLNSAAMQSVKSAITF